MALCRCKQNHGFPNGRSVDYVNAVEPIGYPSTSSICGRNKCENPGVIWLTKEEWKKYQEGIRIFSYASSVSKVRVK